MTAADRTIIARAAEESLPVHGLSELGAHAPVEVRLQYRGYDDCDGGIEARDATGAVLWSGSLQGFLGTIPCFTTRSLIATESGLCPVGELAPGTRVMTRDNGLQEVHWVGRRSLGWRALGLNPLLRPVRLSRGALGNGLPDRDMIVSPNHRFLTLLPGEGESGERLVMARDLVGLDGIAVMDSIAIDYWQILCGRHELLMADGCWSESFFPTEPNCADLSETGRAELRDLLAAREADAATAGALAQVRPDAPIRDPGSDAEVAGVL